jgi:signal transduction histidine kinase
MTQTKSEGTRRWGRSIKFDLVLALVLTALVQFQMWSSGYEESLGPGRVGVAIALFQTVPLIWRRRRILPVFIVTLLSASIPPMIGGLGDNAFGVVGAIVSLYTVSAHLTLRTSLISLAVAGLSATVLHQLPQMEIFDPAYLLVPWIPFTGAWFLGVQVRLRRKYAATLGEREAEIETRRRAEAVNAITEERSRIARDLHDVVGHNLSIIAVQSGAARMYFDSRPGQARGVLSSIEDAANQAIEEMGRLTWILGGPAENPQEAKGVDDIDALVARVTETGVDVALRIEGERQTLSPGLDLSAYRILQEALTNVIKYGTGKRAEVVVRFEARDLQLEVTNESGVGSQGESDPAGGHGLIGMRERVALFSGDFSAAPTKEGDFAVRARIPLETG